MSSLVRQPRMHELHTVRRPGLLVPWSSTLNKKHRCVVLLLFVCFFVAIMDETSAMIEDTFCRLRSRPGVAAVVLLSQDGRLIKSSLAKQELGDKYADIMAKLVAAVRFSLDALDEKTRVSKLKKNCSG